MMSMVYDHYNTVMYNTVMYNTVMLILVIHVRNENYFYYGGGEIFPLFEKYVSFSIRDRNE